MTMLAKGEILRVGRVTGVGDERHLTGWEFDCHGQAFGIARDVDGEVLFAGWRVDELARIAKERGEGWTGAS